MGHIAILGAGSWGTAIAKHLGDKGLSVRLWARSRELADIIERQRQNGPYLPDALLPPNVRCTGELEEAVREAQTVYFVIPSHGLREVATQAAAWLDPAAPMVTASKGIENDSLQLMHQVLSEVLPKAHHPHLCALGGPSFAHEVARQLPTAVCIAGHDARVTHRVQAELASPRFRVYSTDDVLGIELGGALKNVIAIAVGAADGLGFGHNARAALITRGIAEITRLAVQMGAHPQTLAGLGGLGDLVLTCTGDLSRNRRVGLALGAGAPLAEVLGRSTMVAEGVRTAKSAFELGQREGVELPITNEVYAALYEGRPPKEAMQSLLSRALRPERDD